MVPNLPSILLNAAQELTEIAADIPEGSQPHARLIILSRRLERLAKDVTHGQ